jgi:hypothetical protein
MHPKIILPMAAACALFAAAYFASPYWALYRVHNLAERRDLEAMRPYVNRPSIEKVLKKSVAAGYDKKVDQSVKDGDPIGAVANAVSGAVSGSFVEDLVTPEGLAKLLTQGPPPDYRGPPGWRQSSYESWNRFVVVLFDGYGKETNRLLFQRQGFMAWVLVGILVS